MSACVDATRAGGGEANIAAGLGGVPCDEDDSVNVGVGAMVVEDCMVGRGVESGLKVGPGVASEPRLVGAAVVVEYGEKKGVLDGEARVAGPGVEVRLEGEG